MANGSYALATEDRIILSSNLDLPMVPASISKLLTSLLAIRTLGLDYRFRTEFYIDQDKNLFIQGFGDPFLVSEEIPDIMQNLTKRGVNEVRTIFIDDSSFNLSAPPDGAGETLNPYDVSPGGLVVNFNTVNISKDKTGLITSAEPQTPLLPIMKTLGRNLPAGIHRINISHEPENVTTLTGELFRAFQVSAMISGEGPILQKKIPPDAKHIYTHRSSKNLEELITGMLLYSNNFTANQLFLTVGAVLHGYPATWEKAQSAIHDFIDADPVLSKSGITIIEGSGLSRKNKVTARAMLQILKLFRTYTDLLPSENGDLIKSGTLTGVYSYAGYLKRNHSLQSFVIILNQNRNTRDRILSLLKTVNEN
ncbi:MAG: D-alanyl-D-alanine carboxypeptidase [Proteobacteria bacterium]|nr:D-alanyl-D-alanine carboxypeptidase [Pseudomonadota bacterium]MBU1739339.1 D-alanyl-D-alanine carboxypeptidase [Pseudomonadota bacterium]